MSPTSGTRQRRCNLEGWHSDPQSGWRIDWILPAQVLGSVIELIDLPLTWRRVRATMVSTTAPRSSLRRCTSSTMRSFSFCGGCSIVLVCQDKRREYTYGCEFAFACWLPGDHVPFFWRGNDDLSLCHLCFCELHVTYTSRLVCFVGSTEYREDTNQSILWLVLTTILGAFRVSGQFLKPKPSSVPCIPAISVPRVEKSFALTRIWS